MLAAQRPLGEGRQCPQEHETADEFLEIAAEADTDVLLVLETDAFWDEHLAPLRARYAEVEQLIPENHAASGMHLFSKHPLVEPEIRFLFDNITPRCSPGSNSRTVV